MVRVMQHKYTDRNGTEYDSREEYLYHQILLADNRVSCIHRQAKLQFSSLSICMCQGN